MEFAGYDMQNFVRPSGWKFAMRRGSEYIFLSERQHRFEGDTGGFFQALSYPSKNI